VATNQHARNVLGILGGMGPVASAEFVRTIYSYHQGTEQGAPVVMLYSDPTVPDRTEALLRRSDELLLERLVGSLTHLCELGATQIVICCVTSHYLLPRLPPRLRSKITSLLDTIFAGVLRTEKRHLLMCTQGTRQSRLFESHPQWEAARDRVVLARPDDQQQIHELIYRLKRNEEIDELLPLAEALLTKYQVDSFIVGCTELHLVTRRLAQAGDRAQYGYIDPLTMIAESLAQTLAHTAT
jgi:aspartate racemase